MRKTLFLVFAVCVIGLAVDGPAWSRHYRTRADGDPDEVASSQVRDDTGFKGMTPPVIVDSATGRGSTGLRCRPQLYRDPAVQHRNWVSIDFSGRSIYLER